MSSTQVQDPDIRAFEQAFARSEQIVQAISLAHSEAYIVAARAVLSPRDFEVDSSRLNDPKCREAFVDAMCRYYLDQACRFFDVASVPKDPLKAAGLMQACMGSTQHMLMARVRDYGEAYTFKAHMQWQEELLGDVRNQYRASAASHMASRHVSGLVMRMNVEHIVDAEKMSIHDALLLYAEWAQHCSLTRAQIRQLLRDKDMGLPVWLKPPPATS